MIENLNRFTHLCLVLDLLHGVGDLPEALSQLAGAVAGRLAAAKQRILGRAVGGAGATDVRTAAASVTCSQNGSQCRQWA